MASEEMANYFPLHYCMISRNKTLLMSILDSDVNINQLDKQGRTALHVAARENYQEGVESLLERGADVNVQSKSGDTPLHEGINNYEIVKTLLDKGTLPDCRNGRGQTPLFLAVRYQNLQVINLLLSVGVNIDIANIDGKTPLHKAVSNRSHEIIKILVDHGANTEAKTTKLLIDMGASPNVKDGHEKFLKEKNFFERKEDYLYYVDMFPTYGNTPLHIAANNEYSSTIKVLLDGGANPDIINDDGYAPLHISALLGDFKSSQVLLEKGADVNIKARYQENTPLQLAAKHYDSSLIDILIKWGAIVDTNNVEGNTALHEAANSSSPESVKCLLKAGANVNARNEKGETPLHLAVSKSCFFTWDVTQILLDWGASVKLANNQSKTVLDVAHGEQLDLIKKHCVKLMPLNGSQFEVNVTIDLKGYESFHTSCLEELGLMKKKNCGQYSFTDIFYSYNNPFYVNSISLEKELSLIHTEFEFPIYGSMLRPTFTKAKKRFCVMHKLVECFNLNCLPVELKWKILTYLSDENLDYILKIVETC